MKIEGRSIGRNEPVFIVAEVSANHSGSLARAIMLIHAAKEAGADAVKFQLWMTPDEMAPPGVVCPAGPWQGKPLVDLYREAITPASWMETLFTEARKVGIIPFASVFSLGAIAFLEGLGCPAYKIASSESNWPMLIGCAEATGKPVMVSTNDHWPLASIGGNTVLLYCPPGYPAPDETMNLGVLRDSAISHPAIPGFSDHTTGNAAAVMAVALGAKVIEKHIVLDKGEYPEDSPPLDWPFSLAPTRFGEYVQSIRRAEAMMDWWTVTPSPYARSWRFVRDMKAGDTIGPMDVRVLRPAGGMEPSESPLGIVLDRDVGAGEAVTRHLRHLSGAEFLDAMNKAEPTFGGLTLEDVIDQSDAHDS